MTFYAYRTGVSRGRNTYGYNIVTLRNTNTQKSYRTNGGGYDMLGTVMGEILNAEYGDRLLKLHELAENFCETVSFKPGWQTRRAPEKDGTHGRSPNYKKHYYGICAYYTAGKPTRVSLDGATGVSNVKSIAQAIGLEIKEVYDKRGRGNWKLLGVEINPLDGLLLAASKDALAQGQTIAGRAAIAVENFNGKGA